MSKRILPRPTPSKDDFYMGMAFWASAKSKDPNNQSGAFIISFDNTPLGWGYNGPPAKISDTAINWEQTEKADFISCAEENAIDFSYGPLENCIMYVTVKPCPKCILRIVKSGIKKVIYYSSAKKQIADKTEEIAKLGAVQLIAFDGNLNWMRDRMKWMESVGVFD
jgi:dCMP deaminase